MADLDFSGLPPEEQAILSGKPSPAAGAPKPVDTSGLSAEEQSAIANARPAAQPPPPAPVPATWFGRNVSAPFNAAEDPTAPAPPNNYMLGQPWLQSALAGASQGVRDVGQTVNNADAWLARNVPAYAALDRAIGYTPDQGDVSARTKAFEDQYGGDWLASGGRFGGNMLATLPLAPFARAAGAATEAAPWVGRVLGPVVEWGAGGGAQNALTSGGATPEDWGRDFGTGFVGGAATRGVLGAAGRWLLGPAETAVSNMADRLGIRLSGGQQAGGIAKRIEDTTAPFPGSGAPAFDAGQRSDISRMIGREMGIGDVPQIDTSVLNQAEAKTGAAIQNAAARIDVPGNQAWTTQMADIENRAQQAGTGTPQANTFRNLSNQLLNLMSDPAHPDVLMGPQFAKFIARGGPLDTALGSSVPEVRTVGQQVRDALYNAAQSNGQGSLQALQDLQNARYQWKVIQTVRPAIDKTPGGTEEMSLPGLAQSIRNSFDMTNTGAGNNMQDLARLIKGPLEGLRSSGTAERLGWQKLLFGEGLGGSAAGGAFLAGLPHVAAGLAAVTGGLPAAAMLAGRALRYGSGLGSPTLESIQRTFNPLTARITGAPIGNQLLPTSQPQPVPGL